MSDLAVITCALTGVLTNPKQHPVPVTAAEMAASAKAAFDEGAAVMHVHFRQQAPELGRIDRGHAGTSAGVEWPKCTRFEPVGATVSPSREPGPRQGSRRAGQGGPGLPGGFNPPR